MIDKRALLDGNRIFAILAHQDLGQMQMYVNYYRYLKGVKLWQYGIRGMDAIN